MKRRTLFGQLAAIAAAVAAAPAVKAKAVNEPLTWDEAAVRQARTAADEWGSYLIVDGEELAGSITLPPPEQREAWLRDLEAQARAEGYERGRAVAEARAESRAPTSSLTFEAMQQDCAERGCPPLLAHPYPLAPWMSYQHGPLDEFWGDRFLDGHLASVDAWRRSLHKQT